MPLDAADFIAELDINSPPGTDPLNQGDDQIRTSKRTQLNSFPLIGGAVSIDHNQMNQMAIKNELNTFTLDNIFRGRLLGKDGLASSPAYAFEGHGNMGMYVHSPTEVALAASATQVARFGPTGTILPAQLFVGDGSLGVPAFSFANQTNMGFFRNGSGVLSTVVGAVQVRFDQATVTSQTVRLDMSEKIRFNNFNSNHGLTWRANGALTWELIAVHSNAPLTRLTFDRYINNVFQDQPLQLHNDTGHVNMPVLPTGPGGSLVSGSLYAKQSQLFAPTELVVGVQP